MSASSTTTATNDFQREMAIQGVLRKVQDADPELLRALSERDPELAGALAFLLIADGLDIEEGLPEKA